MITALKNFSIYRAKAVPLSSQTFLGRLLFVIIVENARWFSLECFVFFLFASTVLSNNTWRISGHFTPLLSLASLSTYVTSINHISFLNLANALILLNFGKARVNLVYEGFECKNCLTVDTRRLLALTKLRTDP